MNDTRRTMGDMEALQARYALRVAARLNQGAEATGHELSERLRVARERALDCARARRAAAPEAAPAQVAAGTGAATLALGGDPRGAGSPWWARWGAVLPLLALVAGLVLIQNQHVRQQVAAAAEIDFDLLVDELPPSAYSDPGFVEFLKSAHE